MLEIRFCQKRVSGFRKGRFPGLVPRTLRSRHKAPFIAAPQVGRGGLTGAYRLLSRQSARAFSPARFSMRSGFF